MFYMQQFQEANQRSNTQKRMASDPRFFFSIFRCKYLVDNRQHTYFGIYFIIDYTIHTLLIIQHTVPLHTMELT